MKRVVLARDRVETLTRSLKVGDVFYAVVTAKLEKGRYVVRFQNTEFIAVYHGRLQAGAKIRVIAQSLKPHIIFRILSDHELGFDVDAHIHNLEKYACAVSGPVLLLPSYRDFIIVMHNAIDALCAMSSKSHEPVKKNLERLQERSFAHLLMRGGNQGEDILGYFREIQRGDTIDFLRSAITECDELIRAWGSRYDEPFVDHGECLREAYRKVLISFLMEDAINRVSVLSRTGVVLRQCVFLTAKGYRQVTMFYRMNAESEMLFRVIANDETRCACDGMINMTAQSISVQQDPAGSTVHDFLMCLNESGIGRETGVRGDTLSAFFSSEKCTEMHILKPINFNLVV